MPNQKFKPIEPLVAERFREARLSRGFTANELADMVGVSRQSISKYELGIMEPTSQIMEAISEHLNFPIDFFHKPLAISENRGTTFFRSFKTNAARAKEVMSVKSTWATQITSVLSEGILFPAPTVPTLPDKYTNKELSLDDIEDITIYVRDCWNLGATPIPNMVKLLETHGIIIATIKTGFPEADACSSIIGGRPFIFLDTQKECAVRSRFDMAHELGHLILHNNVSQADLEQKNILDKIEREANRFASCFLLPRTTFLLDIRSSSLQSFLPLKKKWKVSIGAMIYRCHELDIFSDNQMLYLQKQISTKRWRKNEPFDDEWPCEEPSVLRTAVTMLIDRGDYLAEDFRQIFRLPGTDIVDLCKLPQGYFSPPIHDKAIVVDFATKTIVDQNHYCKQSF